MKRFTLTAASLLLGLTTAMAQDTKVTGHVVDENGDPVIGATILVKGTTLGTVTDFDGNFTLDVPAEHKHLQISYVGMETQEVRVASRINVTLESDSQALDEVMVVAYGTAKKSSFTGSASNISNEKLDLRPITNLSKGLEGQTTGLLTTSGSGQPGESSKIVIRGYGSINASQDPLYVVDGIPYDGD